VKHKAVGTPEGGIVNPSAIQEHLGKVFFESAEDMNSIGLPLERDIAGDFKIHGLEKPVGAPGYGRTALRGFRAGAKQDVPVREINPLPRSHITDHEQDKNKGEETSDESAGNG